MKRRLTNEQISSIRRSIALKLKTRVQLAREFDVSRQTINNIISGKVYKDVPQETYNIDKERPYHCRECYKGFKSSQLRASHENFCVEDKIKKRKNKVSKEVLKAELKVKNIELTKDILTLFNVDQDIPLTIQHIRKGFKTLSLNAHPDKGGDAEKYKMIVDLYEKLKEMKEDNDLKSLKSDQMLYNKEYSLLIKYREQTDERCQHQKNVREIKTKMSRLRANVGTGNQEYKQYRRELYRLNKKTKPSYVNGKTIPSYFVEEPDRLVYFTHPLNRHFRNIEMKKRSSSPSGLP